MKTFDVRLATHVALVPGLTLGVLGQRSVQVTRIRLLDRAPGMTDDEAAFVSLVGEATNGSFIEINETGTAVSLQPGSIRGGTFAMETKPKVNLTLLLHRLLPLAPFAKLAWDVTLTGGVTDNGVHNADYFRQVTLPLIEKFGLVGAEVHYDKRAALPSGGGAVRFTCPIVRRQLEIPRHLDCADARVAKVRGVAYALRTSPQLGSRVALAAKDELNDVAGDVFFSTDCRSNRKGAGGESPSFGMAIWAELVSERDAAENPSSKVVVHSVLGVAASVNKDESPEAMGKRVAVDFLRQVASRGVVDDAMQPLLVMMMAACPQDVVRSRVGATLTDDCVQALRCCKTFLNVVFKIVQDDAGNGIMLSAVGAGIVNLSRKTT